MNDEAKRLSPGAEHTKSSNPDETFAENLHRLHLINEVLPSEEIQRDEASVKRKRIFTDSGVSIREMAKRLGEVFDKLSRTKKIGYF